MTLIVEKALARPLRFRPAVAQRSAMVDSLRERISHGGKEGCSPLLPQTVDPPHVHGKRRPMSPCTPRAGVHHHGRRSCSRLAAITRLLASRRFLAGMLALTLVLNVAVRLPASWRRSPADYSDPEALSGDATPAVAAAASAGGGGDAASSSAKLIPRILHHVHPSTSALTPAARKRLQSWRAHNPGWEVRHYDNQVRHGCSWGAWNCLVLFLCSAAAAGSRHCTALMDAARLAGLPGLCTSRVPAAPRCLPAPD